MARSKTTRKRREQISRAIKKIKDYLRSAGVEVESKKHNVLIRAYAAKKGKIIPNNIGLKDWAIQNVTGAKPVKKVPKASPKRTASMKEVAEEYAEENRKKLTPAAKHFKKLLEKSGVRFKSEKMIPKPPTFILVDFYIPDRNLCIELDGGYHTDPEQRAKDIERDKYLEVRGYNNWRMTNDEALALSQDDIVAKIESFSKKERTVRIIPYEEPKFGKPKKKKWGNPPSSKKKTKSKKKPRNPLPSPAQIAEKKVRREKLRSKL